MKSLFEISQKAYDLASFLEDGEFTPEMETALAINQEELQKKALNYAYVIKSFESYVDAIDNEVKRLQAMKTAKNNALNRMKDTISHAMQIYGIDKVESPTLKLSFRKSYPVEIQFPEMINSKFKRIKITETETIDKIAIKKAIDAGETVEGAVVNVNYNLQIK